MKNTDHIIWCIALSVLGGCSLKDPFTVGDVCPGITAENVRYSDKDACGGELCPNDVDAVLSGYCPERYRCVHLPGQSPYCRTDCDTSNGEVMCDGKCIHPESDNEYCGASGLCNSTKHDDKNFAGDNCTHKGDNDTKYECIDSLCSAIALNYCNGAYVNYNSDPDNCGGCSDETHNFACDKTNREYCKDGHCTRTTCEDLGSTECNDKCVDIFSDNNNCGGCGNAEEDICKIHGECNEHVCKDGYYCNDGNCNCPEGTFKHGNKCLSPKDDSSCGATADSPGVVCTNTTGHCDPDTKTCRLCKNGYVQCSKIDGTGVFHGSCIDPSADDNYCGVSSDCKVTEKNICKNDMQCEYGKCKCPEGYAACGDHGQCVSLTNEVWDHHCGATVRGRCDQPDKQSSTDPGPDYMGIRCGANQTCSEKGECVCNGTWCNDECVRYFDADMNNCGACGNGHVLFGTDADNLTGDCTVIDKERATCNNGKCACEDELELIKVRGSENKWICIDPNTDVDYCGPDHKPCEGKCENGECKPLNCDSPLVNCKGRCVNLDDLNMVKCMECKSGYCEHSNMDVTLTNGCLEIGDNDNQNCGTCGNECPQNTNCENKECKPAEGYLLCSGKVYNKAELKLKTCTSCADGFEDMDDNYLNGCEINLKTNKYHCGERGYDCTKHLSNVFKDSITCENGLCTYTTCANIAHYADCNNDKASSTNVNRDGCETDITTDSNCSRCNNTCNNGLCENGECCYDNYGDILLEPAQIKCCSGQSLYHYKHNYWVACYKDSRYGCFDPNHADDLSSCWDKK